jgi:hypothetical protein
MDEAIFAFFGLDRVIATTAVRDFSSHFALTRLARSKSITPPPAGRFERNAGRRATVPL